MKKASLVLNVTVLIAVLSLSVGVTLKAQTTFKNVTIGKQVWMTENLTVDKFRNGDPIPEAKTIDDWKKAAANKQPAWCNYNNDLANGKKYGKLYNWYALNDPRGLAPVGWHISSDAEWTNVVAYLGGEKVAGKKMKSTSGWGRGVDGGDNSSGFTALPGGYRTNVGAFSVVGDTGYWWSSTESAADYGWGRAMYYGGDRVQRFDDFKSSGFSVRCVRD